MEFKLDKDGYITKYLYSGRKETEFHDEGHDTNQLRYEKYLRSIIAKHEAMVPNADIQLGGMSGLGMPWKYYYSYGNVFLSDSSFYIELRRVDLYAATELIVEEDMEVSAYLWSYAAVDLWVNGVHAGAIMTPVYKPISRVEVKLSLKKGRNRIFIRLENLGVRDTRTSFAICIRDHQEAIRVGLPDEAGVEPYLKAEEIINSGTLVDHILHFTDKLPTGSVIIYDTENPDYRKMKNKLILEDVSGLSVIKLKEYASFRIRIPVGTGTISRHFERIELRTSRFIKSTYENNQDMIFQEVAKVTSLIREETDGFALYPLLARYYLGEYSAADEEEIRVTLKQIDRRMDCADFMTCGLIRLMKKYQLPEDIVLEIKRVMLNFRYWMDEDGQDGMCFWSENHSLMFYQTAYFFGQEYPEEVFKRSGKTGRKLQDQARVHLYEWFSDVCEQGFDEFNSGVYTPITFSAMLNIVDFAEEELSVMAVKACDLLIKTLCRHSFQNVLISPQGRVYRDVLYPHLQSLQSIVQYISKDAPYAYSEWLSALATSRYQMPADLVEQMNQTGGMTYQSSNAVIDLYKTKDYMLTSVQSPRRDGKLRVWEAEYKEENREKHIYTKSLNECFHGTMQFEPGVFGYQQHLWYAAIDPELVVFINHPGGTCETMSEERPGYWFGNGIMPALHQEKNVLGVVYVIPDTHPIGFTHMFWNTRKFDESLLTDGWLFGRKNGSYIGIWCSQELSNHNDVLFECEKRAYGRKTAYLVVCGSELENESFKEFMKQCIANPVEFQQEHNTLSCQELSITFEPHQNRSQYVD